MTNVAQNREVVGPRSSGLRARRTALARSRYAEDFVDDLGRLEYRALDGARRSTAL